MIELVDKNQEEVASQDKKLNNDIVKFKVEKAQFKTDTNEYEHKYIITKNDIPDYLVNDFLLEKSKNKISTSRAYAYSLVKLLNFLAEKNIHYLDCTKYMAKQYVRSLVLGDMEDLRIKDIKNRVTYSTLCTDTTVLNEFFKFLYIEQQELKLDIKFNKKANTRSYMYGQIFEFDYMEKIVSGNIKNLKPSKEYIKWYSDEQIGAILSNFKTLRDEAVFLLTLEGMRIDEVLSLKLDGIDEIERTVQPTRSKGKQDSEEYGGEKNEIRIVSIPQTSFDVLINYIYSERADAESESGIYDDYVFINLRKGANQGKQLSYHNYLKILKGVAKKAGLNSKKIRTHSGRSTKVNQLQEHQVLHPEDCMTDDIIRQILGWESIQTIDSYKNRGNRIIQKSASEKVYRHRKEPKQLQEEFEAKNKGVSNEV